MYNISYSHKGQVDTIQNKLIVHVQSVDYKNRNLPVVQHDLLIDTGAFITMLNKTSAEECGYPIIDERGCAISGFSQQGLLCDVRKIPIIIFCGFIIKDVIITTPHDDHVIVSEVLGMNVLENFDFGLSQTNDELYLNKRNFVVSEKPKYQSGAIGLLVEASFGVQRG